MNLTDKPYFSVIIPVYNSGNFIKRTINSVLDQAFHDFEIIAINDGSTDNSAEIIKSIKDKRVNLITKTNGGVSSARNIGLSTARGQYIAFLDSDDFWYPNHLSMAYNFFCKHPEIKWYSSASHISTNNNDTWASSISPTTKTYIYDFIAYAHRLIWTSTTVIEKKLAQKVRGFPETCKYGEDSCYWYKIGITSPLIGYNKNVTAIRTVRNDSITKTQRRTNTYILECIKFRQSHSIKNDKALQGMMLSIMVYNLKKKYFKDFKQLLEIIHTTLGTRLTLKTFIQIINIFTFKRFYSFIK